MTTFEPNAGATMPARLSLTKAQRDALLLLPDTKSWCSPKFLHERGVAVYPFSFVHLLFS
jgi:hypothetical protein